MLWDTLAKRPRSEPTEVMILRAQSDGSEHISGVCGGLEAEVPDKSPNKLEWRTAIRRFVDGRNDENINLFLDATSVPTPRG